MSSIIDSDAQTAELPKEFHLDPGIPSVRRDAECMQPPPVQATIPQGAEVTAAGVSYKVWAPVAKQVDLEIQGKNAARQIPMRRTPDGYFLASDELGRAGDLYKFKLGDGPAFPDPASRFQPQGVHGPS